MGKGQVASPGGVHWGPGAAGGRDGVVAGHVGSGAVQLPIGDPEVWIPGDEWVEQAFQGGEKSWEALVSDGTAHFGDLREAAVHSRFQQLVRDHSP